MLGSVHPSARTLRLRTPLLSEEISKSEEVPKEGTGNRVPATTNRSAHQASSAGASSSSAESWSDWAHRDDVRNVAEGVVVGVTMFVGGPALAVGSVAPTPVQPFCIAAVGFALV